MKSHFGRPMVLILIIAATLSTSFVVAKKKLPPTSPQMDERKRALHVLNRLTFGPKPGDVDRVLSQGVDKWIHEQLHPDKIDDSALESRLATFRTLHMSTGEIVENFPPEPVIKAIADGKQSMPSDPLQRAVYQAQVDRFEQRQEHKQEPNSANAAPAANPTGQASEIDRKAEQLFDLPPDQRMKAFLKLSPDEQRALTASLRGQRRDDFMGGMNPRQRETLMAIDDPQAVVANELTQAKLLRVVYSERQLQEVMADFWFNHFNVFIGKGADRYLLTSYERDVIRPHALGKFEDLLVSTAQSPAMLFYLDNWLSVGPNSDIANGVRNDRDRKRMRSRMRVNQAKGKRNGLNENYGRELMELHSLGVDGGYTQKDVTEVARVFTGWTLKQPREGGGFTFEERMHEPGDKIVLGRRIKPNGEKEGRQVLHILAHHPSTARFICKKLAVRFVSDDPPSTLVDRMAQTFLQKDGDIRDVLETMFDSPEFWAPAAYRAKVKTPLEFVASALRASGGDITNAMPLARQLQNMGMPLYGMQPPTGYSSKSDAWVNSSALLNRLNFAMALAAGKLPGSCVDAPQLVPEQARARPSETLLALEKTFLDGDVSQQTQDILASRMQDPKVSHRMSDQVARSPNIAAIAGLLMGSPEFQKR